jgi:hypothetical protein
MHAGVGERFGDDLGLAFDTGRRVADLLITAQIRSPSARALASGLSTTTPTPRPNTVPFAATSKGRQ